jgi:hypothetical protein
LAILRAKLLSLTLADLAANPWPRDTTGLADFMSPAARFVQRLTDFGIGQLFGGARRALGAVGYGTVGRALRTPFLDEWGSKRDEGAGAGNAFGRKLSNGSAADSVEKRWFGQDKPLEKSKKSCPYRIPPLEVPPADEKELNRILGHSAVELFVARAQALDYSPNRDALPLIADICRRLDGIPLAIEFAAARTATLGIEYVATGLNDRFALLTSGRRTALPRQRTLRATLDWSYELLPPGEAGVLTQLAIFAGDFSLHAAAAVVGDATLRSKEDHPGLKVIGELLKPVRDAGGSEQEVAWFGVRSSPRRNIPEPEATI